MIAEKAGMGPGGPGQNGNTNLAPQGWGNAYQQWNQGHPNDPSGQPDYSAQWADYYRSMGMHREAEAIEQQAKGMKVGGPGGPTPNAAPQQGGAGGPPGGGPVTPMYNPTFNQGY